MTEYDNGYNDALKDVLDHYGREGECKRKCIINVETAKRKETCLQCIARHLTKEDKA